MHSILKRITTRIGKCGVALILAILCGSNSLAQRPNIVIILADDMGYSDIGCYGGEIDTPNIDRLAADGLRFTQFYNTGRCCPTRASLLTGLYPHQAGVGHMVNDRGQPGYRGRLSDTCVTIAEVLRSAGYRTIMTGKWHVTPFSYENDIAPHKRPGPFSAASTGSTAPWPAAAATSIHKA